MYRRVAVGGRRPGQDEVLLLAAGALLDEDEPFEDEPLEDEPLAEEPLEPDELVELDVPEDESDFVDLPPSDEADTVSEPDERESVR
ncbi:hypothetical protein [Micromonospora sp. NPDC023737]|uniref:hypothetical protein n=1 Tax=unclassified Micromonospora TaxID=2617518 RepID=UPI0033CE0518